MTFKEFLGYALGTAFVIAVFAAMIGGLVLFIAAIPLMLLLFPLTAAIVALFLLVGYARHRRGR